jgi:hypothetical protein
MTKKHRNNSQSSPQARIRKVTRPRIDFVQGYLELGLLREAMLAAKHQLRSPAVNATTFASAVDAVIMFSNHPRIWKRDALAAFVRLTPRDQRTTAHLLVLFLL